MKQRNIFRETENGFKDPACWCVAFVLWAALWNSPKLWELTVAFVKGFFL